MTVTKEGVGTSKGNVNVRGGRVPANFVLGMTAGEGLSKTFNEGVAASAAGNFDDAIAKFNEALKTNPAVLRLLLQHRRRAGGQEGLRRRRSRLQEGD